MPRTARQPRAITGAEPDTFALTLDELALHIAEQPEPLRRKVKAGQFPGAYRTAGWKGDWRIPMKSVRAYQKGQAVTIAPEDDE